GQAAFTGLTLNAVSNGTPYMIMATASGITGATVTTSGINVTASQLAITPPPTSTFVSVPFTLVVNAQDGKGNTDTTFAGTVNRSLSNNAGSAALTSGISSITVSSGGTKYNPNSPPAVTFTGGGGGTGLAATILASQINPTTGAITGITVTSF